MKKSEFNIIQSLDNGERVTSNYAQIYLDDDYCEHEAPSQSPTQDQIKKSKSKIAMKNDDWVSPSDLLIDKIDLIPPFTSKITRGITHKGILEIGDGVLQKERDKFLKHLSELLANNDSAWTHIQEQEKIVVAQKVKAIYERIFQRKSALMHKEISMFYEESLRELEKHLRTEVRSVLISAHCNIIGDLNRQIADKLQKEKMMLEKILRKKYNDEIRKIKKYYFLLLHNEKHRSNKLVNQALHDRNDALTTFCRQIETDTITSVMYVMCTERKKCKMRQFQLQNLHTKEIEDKLKIIKEKQEILDEFNKGKKQIFDINKEWEEKVKKILQLFLKFLSFSLKLLPEQTTFLLDLEKLVVLQLNEIQKHPLNAATILKNKDDFENFFEFKKTDKEDSTCDLDPFVIEGDLSPSIPTPYGSTETLPSHVDLPFLRLQRQFIYAKCQKIDEVRNYLESIRCKCNDPQTREPSHDTASSSTESAKTPSPEPTPISSNEVFMVNEIDRLYHCPYRGCQQMTDRLTFPNLNDYVDFDEIKFARVEAILGKRATLKPPPPLTDPKDIIRRELVFSATSEPYHNVETQYSNPDTSEFDVAPCPCMDDGVFDKIEDTTDLKTSKDAVNLNKVLYERSESLKRLIHDNPKLLKLFSEESFDFIL